MWLILCILSTRQCLFENQTVFQMTMHNIYDFYVYKTFCTPWNSLFL